MPRTPDDFKCRKEKISTFINAVIQLIGDGDIKNVSIRKIAEITGYNSATLYNYFNNLDHLILFSSIRYFKEYNIAISLHTKKHKDPYLQFVYLWQTFCEMVFPKQHIFYNMFFGKYSDNLEQVIDEYNTIFPEDFTRANKYVFEMLKSGDILRRNFAIIEPLIATGYISENNANDINEIIIFCFKELLWKKCQSSNQKDDQYFINKQMSYIKIIFQKCKP